MFLDSIHQLYSFASDINQDFRSKYSQVNYLLLEQIMSVQSIDKLHLQVSHPLDLKDLYKPFVFSTLRYQYQQNLLNAENRFFKELKNGDLVYDASKNEVRKYLYRRDLEKNLVFAPQKNNKNNTNTFFSENKINHLLHLVGRNESNNAKTYLKRYSDFVQTHLNENRLLSTFNKRILLVTNLNWLDKLEELSHLPIQVGHRERYLPIQPLIEVYNDMEDALKTAKENEGMYNLVYVGNNIDSVMNDAINYQGDGFLERLIFITSCNISKDYGFKKWAWTREETVFLKETSENVKRLRIDSA